MFVCVCVCECVCVCAEATDAEPASNAQLKESDEKIGLLHV